MALTKSRFALATQCATRLYYKDRKDEYVDNSLDDDFLLSLAEGGFQVGALARVMFGGGILLEEGSLEERLRQTSELMLRDEVTIYEAVIRAGDLLVVVDVLRKRGRDVDLMEVKAKSYDAARDRDLRSKGSRAISETFRPYLNDVAFQVHVFRRAWPGLDVQPFLVLVDKTATTSVAGLNARFKVRRSADGQSSIETVEGTDATTIGQPILRALPVAELVEEILGLPMRVGEVLMPFDKAVETLLHAHLERARIWTPPGRQCIDCQFRAAPDGQRLSGYRECWSRWFGWRDADFDEPSVLDLWNLAGTVKDTLIDRRKLKLREVDDDDLGGGDDHEQDGGLTTAGRQRLQVRAAREGNDAIWFDAVGFSREKRTWTWPLNFIDFETCMVAVPFTRGRRPYEPVAFQFSHHVRHADGRVEHAAQYIDTQAGHFPNYGFVRALRAALTGNDGTIFRWHHHENTILRAIRDQLVAESDDVPDRAALVGFIDLITHGDSDDGKSKVRGARDMVDLCDVAQRFYFDPATRGSSSLKKVLPSLMRHSAWLRQRYGAPVYGRGRAIPSLNFDEPVTWWREENGRVVDPYSLLPPIFDDLSLAVGDQDRLEFALPERLREGGAAMTAYARLQFEGMPQATRAAVEKALLEYCELDTLAMVMAVEAWEANV